MNAPATATKTAKPIPEDIAAELAMQGIAPGSYDFAPLDGLRKLIARRMVEAVQTAPHFSLDMKIELDPLLALRERINGDEAVRVSVNDMLIKAAGLALVQAPGVNVSFTSAGIVRHHHADVAFAVAMDGGLVTPIIREAETKSLREIAAETRDLAARGRIKRLKPEEYSGGSFSLSNLGMFGVSRFDAIINRPQGAILSVGTGEKCFLFDGDAPRVATVMTATLTSDHRAIDGAVAAQWLKQLKTIIEAPEAMIGS